MNETPEYWVEDRPEERAALVRVGKRGGVRLVAVYKNRATAERVAKYLDAMSREEV